MLNHNRLRLGGELESAHNRSQALVSLDVRFGSLTDIRAAKSHVRFTPNSGINDGGRRTIKQKLT
jgi:hypothetical protein